MTLSAARSGWPAVAVPPAKDIICPLIDKPCVHDRRLAVVLWPLPFGQFRIHLVEREASEPSRPACRDRIVVQLVSYDVRKATTVAGIIVVHEDPKAYCENAWRIWSASKVNDLIRLDARPAQEGEDDGI